MAKGVLECGRPVSIADPVARDTRAPHREARREVKAPSPKERGQKPQDPCDETHNSKSNAMCDACDACDEQLRIKN
jgi:hypothetical protein